MQDSLAVSTLASPCSAAACSARAAAGRAEQPPDRLHRLGGVGSGCDTLLGAPPRRGLDAEHDVRADRVDQCPHRKVAVARQQSSARRLPGVGLAGGRCGRA